MDLEHSPILRAVAQLEAKVDALAAGLLRLHEDAITARAATEATRAARAKLDAELDELPDRVAANRRLAEAVDARLAALEQRPTVTPSVLADPAVRSWSLRVVGIVAAAAVASSLALAGGMTYGDVSRWLPAAVSGGVTIDTER